MKRPLHCLLFNLLQVSASGYKIIIILSFPLSKYVLHPEKGAVSLRSGGIRKLGDIVEIE